MVFYARCYGNTNVGYLLLSYSVVEKEEEQPFLVLERHVVVMECRNKKEVFYL